jgi:glycosyltransferase involved in cell wall biosynthesis
MRILEACFSPALGGLELYCLNISRRLKSRGHEVHLWLARNSRMQDHPLAAGLEPVAFDAPGYVNPRFTRNAARFIRDQRIQIIHLHRAQDLAVFAPLRSVYRILTLQIDSALPKRDLWHRWVYGRLDLLLAITERIRQRAIRALPISPDRVHTLYYGIDADEFFSRRMNPEQTRGMLGIREEDLVIGLVGRLEASKGQDVLLEAFARIYADFPRAHLIFAGNPPPEHAGYDVQLKQKARALQVIDRCHFIGFQADTAPIFAALDVAVLASRQEAFGLVLLEAMAMGVPIIATAAGGVPEIIQDGKNGLLVPPGDAQALAEALRRLLKSEGLREQLARNGSRVVREKFALKDHLENLERHFHDLILSGKKQALR